MVTEGYLGRRRDTNCVAVSRSTGQLVPANLHGTPCGVRDGQEGGDPLSKIRCGPVSRACSGRRAVAIRHLRVAQLRTDRHTEAIMAAGRAGYDVLVIDSLSHAWEG